MAAGINISDLAAEKIKQFLAAEKRAGQGLRLKGCGSDRRYITRAYPSRIRGAFSQRLCGVAQVKRCGTRQRECTPQPRRGHVSQRFFIVKVDPSSVSARRELCFWVEVTEYGNKST